MNAIEPNTEQQHVHTLAKKMDQIRDAVSNVVSGHRNGLILTGEGGSGKSYLILAELEKYEDIELHHHQGRLSARALFDTLKAHCNETDIHLVEDCESMFADKLWSGVMRNALWSQNRRLHPTRHVTWGIFNRDEEQENEFNFQGGIILVSNVRLDGSKADIRAIKSRVQELVFSLNEGEL
jgi:hypothetical protein